MKIIAEIPARAGSQRIKNKNLRLLNGHPMIKYAIDAARGSLLLDDVYVNSDSDEIGNYGKSLGVNYYKRPEKLANNTATSDEYNYDFFKVFNPDLLVQINPVCPMITSKDIDEIVQFFLKNNFDSLITVRKERLHAFCNGEPINVDITKQLPRTQDIEPILICAWPICIWRKESFIKSYEEKGHAVLSGNIGFYPVSLLTSMKISYEEDFILVDKLMRIS